MFTVPHQFNDRRLFHTWWQNRILGLSLWLWEVELDIFLMVCYRSKDNLTLDLFWCVFGRVQTATHVNRSYMAPIDRQISASLRSSPDFCPQSLHVWECHSAIFWSRFKLKKVLECSYLTVTDTGGCQSATAPFFCTMWQHRCGRVIEALVLRQIRGNHFDRPDILSSFY